MPTIYDNLIAQQTLLELYKSKGLTDTQIALNNSLELINARILKTNGTWTRQKLNAIKKLIQDEISKSYGGLFEAIKDESVNIAEISYGVIATNSVTASLPKALVDDLTRSDRLIRMNQNPDAQKAYYNFAQLMNISEEHSQTLRNYLADRVRIGDTPQQITRELSRLNTSISRGRLASNVRTVIFDSANNAQYKAFEKLEKQGLIDYYEHVSVLDGNTSSLCQRYDGRKYYMPMEEIALTDRPPLHGNCFTGDTLVSTTTRISNVTRRIYEGSLYIITSASGNKLKCTPNHPILTNRGFISAKDINKSDKLALDKSDVTRRINIDKNNTVTTFENLFASFEMMGNLVSMPVSAKDFHGDVTNDKVDIINADSLLSNNISKGKRSNNISFISRYLNIFSNFSCFSSFFKFFNRDNSIFSRFVSRFNLVNSLFFTHKSPFNRFLFGLSSKFNALSLKFRLKIRNAYMKSLFNTFKTNPVFVQSDSTFKSENSVMPQSKINRDSALLSNDSIDDFMSDAELFSNICNGSFGDKVLFDDIVDISISENVSCHVYNLENDLHYYTANNLIVHNCRSKLVPRNKMSEEGTRSSQFGAVPSTETYSTWFSRQSATFQRSVLGNTKYNAFKSGTYKIGGLPDVLGKNIDLDKFREYMGSYVK